MIPLRCIARWFKSQLDWLFSRRRKPEENREHLRTSYFDLGLHYYIAARYATIARLNPVAGNLAHHALEFCLKGALTEFLDEDERRKLGHNLNKIWQRYKKKRKRTELDKFDQTISDINKFEKIRYPEEILRLGMTSEIGFVRSQPLKKATRGRLPSGARYQLILDEVDELVESLFKIESLNPAFFISSLNKDARQYLENQNSYSMK